MIYSGSSNLMKGYWSTCRYTAAIPRQSQRSTNRSVDLSEEKKKAGIGSEVLVLACIENGKGGLVLKRIHEFSIHTDIIPLNLRMSNENSKMRKLRQGRSGQRLDTKRQFLHTLSSEKPNSSRVQRKTRNAESLHGMKGKKYGKR